MDIRVVSESIFNIESDCIVYFVDNAFSNDDTMEIISKAGNRLLDVFSKLSSLATGEYKIIPAFNLKTIYTYKIKKKNQRIHADLNGAFNIMRKAGHELLEKVNFLNNNWIFPVGKFKVKKLNYA